MEVSGMSNILDGLTIDDVINNNKDAEINIETLDDTKVELMQKKIDDGSIFEVTVKAKACIDPESAVLNITNSVYIAGGYADFKNQTVTITLKNGGNATEDRSASMEALQDMIDAQNKTIDGTIDE